MDQPLNPVPEMIRGWSLHLAVTYLAAKVPENALEENPQVPGVGLEVGKSNTISKGREAPTANVAADDSAAWIGRAVRIVEITS
jgi:hypothetical protein